MIMKRWKFTFLGLLLAGILLTPSVSATPIPPPLPLPKQQPLPMTEMDFEYSMNDFMPAGGTPGPIYGLNFISNAEDMGAGRVDETQYQNGLSTGAKWNRWPLYWQRIEQSENQFNWA